MKIISIERDDRDFFCPVTGQPIYNEAGEPVAPSFRAFWHGEVLEEPTISDEGIQQAWDTYLDKVEAADGDGWIEMEEFLSSYERSGLVAFEITTRGFACGPIWETVWTVLDLEYHAEK